MTGLWWIESVLYVVVEGMGCGVVFGGVGVWRL